MSVLAEKIAEVVSSGGFRDDDGVWHAGLTVADAHHVERIIRVVREVLLSDQAIEKAARAMHADLNRRWPEYSWMAWDQLEDYQRAHYRDDARAALDAVTGEDQG